MECLSRVTQFFDLCAKSKVDGQPLQGHDSRNLHDFAGYEEIVVIFRWKDGYLNDDGQLPAVEFQDCHIEHFRNGKLHNDNRDPNGDLMPAIITNYGKDVQYYIDGKQEDKHFKPD